MFLHKYVHLEIKLQFYTISTSPTINYACGSLPIVIASIAGIGYILLIEQVVYIAAQCSTYLTQIKGISRTNIECTLGETGAGVVQQRVS